MKIYISGPMTGKEDHNFPAFNEAARKFLSLGYETFNPASRGVLDGWEWADYMKDDIAQLVKCDTIALLDDWETSRGATLELFIASQLKMTVWVQGINFRLEGD